MTVLIQKDEKVKPETVTAKITKNVTIAPVETSQPEAEPDMSEDDISALMSEAIE